MGAGFARGFSRFGQVAGPGITNYLDRRRAILNEDLNRRMREQELAGAVEALLQSRAAFPLLQRSREAGAISAETAARSGKAIEPTATERAIEENKSAIESIPTKTAADIASEKSRLQLIPEQTILALAKIKSELGLLPGATSRKAAEDQAALQELPSVSAARIARAEAEAKVAPERAKADITKARQVRTLAPIETAIAEQNLAQERMATKNAPEKWSMEKRKFEAEIGDKKFNQEMEKLKAAINYYELLVGTKGKNAKADPATVAGMRQQVMDVFSVEKQKPGSKTKRKVYVGDKVTLNRAVTSIQDAWETGDEGLSRAQINLFADLMTRQYMNSPEGADDVQATMDLKKVDRDQAISRVYSTKKQAAAQAMSPLPWESGATRPGPVNQSQADAFANFIMTGLGIPGAAEAAPAVNPNIAAELQAAFQGAGSPPPSQALPPVPVRPARDAFMEGIHQNLVRRRAEAAGAGGGKYEGPPVKAGTQTIAYELPVGYQIPFLTRVAKEMLTETPKRFLQGFGQSRTEATLGIAKEINKLRSIHPEWSREQIYIQAKKNIQAD